MVFVFVRGILSPSMVKREQRRAAVSVSVTVIYLAL